MHVLAFKNSKTARGFPGELRQTNAKNAKLPIALPGSTKARGNRTKLTAKGTADNAYAHRLDIKSPPTGININPKPNPNTNPYTNPNLNPTQTLNFSLTLK